VALSETSRREIVAAYPEVEGKTRIVPIGVDVGRFPLDRREAHRREMRRRWSIPEGRRVVLFVGHHFKLKGLAPALEAVARIPVASRPHLLVVGGGRAAPFRRGAVRLGLRGYVTFAGPVSGIESVYLGSDLLLQPTFYDPCSHATLEAWAAGIPVVTTSRNGAAELGEGGPAVAVMADPRDREALALAVEEMLQDDRWPERSGEARRVAESQGLDRHVERMEDILRSVTGKEDRERAHAPEGSR
jgi:UDP-glucose:(heptosyl)LPS alpha-1,3-glucosyltransferase